MFGSNSGDAGAWAFFVFFVFGVAIADIILKAFALWKSARAGERNWFIALMIVNSMGILPIIYLLTHKNKGGSEPSISAKTNTSTGSIQQ